MVRVSYLMENRKVLALEFARLSLQFCLIAVPHQIMEKLLSRYEGNGSSRYDEKEYLESASRIRKEKNVRGPLKIGEYITINTKSSIWKAVVNTNPYAPPKKEKQQRSEQQLLCQIQC